MAKPGSGWVPNQFGSYAMVVAPPIVGVTLAGWRWADAGLFVTWILAFCTFSALRLKLVARNRSRFRTPLITYSALSVLAALAMVVSYPALLRWAPVLIVLGAPVILIVRSRGEHSLVGNALPMAFACLMTVIAAGLTGLVDTPQGLGAGWLPPGADLPMAWLAAALLFGYFFGTAFYVKTMIREKGKLSWYLASVLYHVALLAIGILVAALLRNGASWALPAAALLCLLRAALVPKRWPNLKPARLGSAEFGVAALFTVAVCVAL